MTADSIFCASTFALDASSARISHSAPRIESAKACALPPRAASILEITSAPKPDCGLRLEVSARRLPFASYRRAARVVVPMSITAPKHSNVGSSSNPTCLPPVTICAEAADPRLLTSQSPSAKVQQERRMPSASSLPDKSSRSASLGGESLPLAKTLHFPHLP